jgi:hypothetical protein
MPMMIMKLKIKVNCFIFPINNHNSSYKYLFLYAILLPFNAFHPAVQTLQRSITIWSQAFPMPGAHFYLTSGVPDGGVTAEHQQNSSSFLTLHQSVNWYTHFSTCNQFSRSLKHQKSNRISVQPFTV